MTRVTSTILGVASAVALTAAPALAQHRGGSHVSGSHRSGGAHVSRAYAGRVTAGVPRGSVAVRGGVYRTGVYGRGFLRVAPTRFYRPYYTFQSRVSLGAGLWVGYPFAYSYPFYDPYAYASPYASPVPQALVAEAGPPLASGDSLTAQPNQAHVGGLSFDITPTDAQIVVDGRQVGTVGQFTSTSEPLGLSAGHHHVEIRATGYRTMRVDVEVIAGQVIPYQGTLER